MLRIFPYHGTGRVYETDMDLLAEHRHGIHHVVVVDTDGYVPVAVTHYVLTAVLGGVNILGNDIHVHALHGQLDDVA